MNFAELFKRLTGNLPFPWQAALYERFLKGEIPDSADIPTGLGKTSVVAIWLIALANSKAGTIPRRLVYVVNRRTVVDQTTDEVVQLRNNLELPQLEHIKKRLAALCALEEYCKGSPLAISTLRGQFADNREWSADPCRPAIIVGTVDMIGSRLLFGGYGVGFRQKPLHAGFLGQDTLIVHDEAHLEPAFQKLLIALEKEQGHCNDPRKIRVMELTATRRGNSESFTLGAEDEKNSEVGKRLSAHKELRLHEESDPKRLSERLVKLALEHAESNSAVLVFARTIDDVEKTRAALEKVVGKDRVRSLTGTMRGWERERLVDENDNVFKRFLPKPTPGENTVYLVCTSAGEVGVNISADHLVCDLSTFESMAQRLGRVNRFGLRNDSRVDVVHPASFGEEAPGPQLERTLALLKKLRGDASPAALREKLDAKEKAEAFSPEPIFRNVTDILLDAWSLTSIREALPGRPALDEFLHGVAGWEPPETHVAWRQEVDLIRGEMLALHDPATLLEDWPIKPHELLRDRSDRVFKQLAKIAQRVPDAPVWLLRDDETVEANLTLQELVAKRKEEIEGQTILLGELAGGLAGAGTLDGDEATPANDVSERWREDEKGNKQRLRKMEDDAKPEPPAGMRLIRQIELKKPDAKAPEDEDAISIQYWRWYERPAGGDSQGSRFAEERIELKDHLKDVESRAAKMAASLGLEAELETAVTLAAACHDLGKDRERWQRSIGNPNPAIPWAKSGSKAGPRMLGDSYRHEFGSLVDISKKSDLQNLKQDSKELCLHLIAAHHGRGRPHFAPDEFDPAASEDDVRKISVETSQRFARLQRKHGRWGLAFLESILRAADYAASATSRERAVTK